MKTIWQLTYETIPGDGEQIKKYKSFSEAKKDIKKMISQINIAPYTEAIREGGVYKTYRTAMADFLDNYISRKDFLSETDPLPSSEADDYEFERKMIRNDAYKDADEEEEEDEEEDEIDDFEIYIGKDSLLFDCYYEGCPHLDTDMVVMDDETKDYCFQFYVDKAPKNKLRELQMTLIPIQYLGTSSYPILILRTLENSREPLDQQQIISRIYDDHDTKIERKAIGRNIALLKYLGYDIEHNAEGYFIPKKATFLEQEDFNAIVESIKADETLDDDRKRELIDKLCKI